MNSKEDMAYRVYELVEDRLPTKQIVEKLSNEANIILTTYDYEQMEQLISKYKDSRKGLEETAEKIFKLLKPKFTDPFPDPLKFDFGATFKYKFS